MRKQNVVTVLAPAKLNLALDVVGLLPNGYHDLDMTMQAITLYERVVLRRSPYLNLRLPGSLVAPNNKNTAIKAALAFFHYTGLLAGVDITIYKNTPVRAGMAGGSADAAAVLVGLNELYGARLSMSELCALGASIGADVPFALMGGTCRVQGVGDLLKPLGRVERIDRVLQAVIFLLRACDGACEPLYLGVLLVDLGAKAHQGNSSVHNEDQNHQLDQQRRLDELHSGVCSFPVVRVSNRKYAYRSL